MIGVIAWRSSALRVVGAQHCSQFTQPSMGGCTKFWTRPYITFINLGFVVVSLYLATSGFIEWLDVEVFQEGPFEKYMLCKDGAGSYCVSNASECVDTIVAFRYREFEDDTKVFDTLVCSWLT